MAITYADGIEEQITKRGLKKNDIEAVIDSAGEDRIYNGKEYIVKKTIGDLTVYAKYTVNGADVTVTAGYSHRMKILDIVMSTDDTGWTYCKNGNTVKKGHTDLTYLGATRSGPALVEPVSGESWFEEYLAAGALTTAEGLFAQKRA